MVKLFAMIPRKPGISRDEFHDHYRHPHMSLGAQIEEITHIVQSHQFDSEHLGADQRRYEALGEAWFESLSTAVSLGEHAIYTLQVQPDEPNFVDLSRLNWLFTDTEDVLIDRPRAEEGFNQVDCLWSEERRPVSVKLTQFIESGANLGWASDRDKDLGKAIGAFRHVRRYAAREAHGDNPPFLGTRELWWPSHWAFDQGAAADPHALSELLARPGKSVTLVAYSERWR
jgi:hypothetical protein